MLERKRSVQGALESLREHFIGVFQKFLRGIVEKLLSPSTLEEVPHAQVLQSVKVNLFTCLHEAGSHGRECFETGRLHRLATSKRLLSELVVKSERSLHRFSYGNVHFLVELKLRF